MVLLLEASWGNWVAVVGAGCRAKDCVMVGLICLTRDIVSAVALVLTMGGWNCSSCRLGT